MTTFTGLINDLTRDAERAQPKDALQFCANWFHARLEEQRARTFDLGIGGIGGGGMSARSSLGSRTSFDHTISPLQRRSSPFGTLNVPGNALLEAHLPLPPPQPPTGTSGNGSTTTFTNPFSSSPTLTHIPLPLASAPAPGDYLHPPTSAIFARRTSVSAESISVEETSTQPLPYYAKTPTQLARIKESIKDNFIFRDLDDEQETGVLNAMREVDVERGEVVIRQGDVGEYFYVVEKGRLDCFIDDGAITTSTIPEEEPPSASIALASPSSPSSPQSPSSLSTGTTVSLPGGSASHHPVYGRLVASCTPGTSFGELALMYGHPRAATVLSLTSSVLWALDRITFRTIILKAAHRRRTMYESFLSSVTLLAGLSPPERSKIADALVSRVYEDGERVVTQGEVGDTFFFVEEGEAIVTKRAEREGVPLNTTPTQGEGGQEDEFEVGRLVKGDYFGELSLLRLAPRAATVSAVVRTNPSPSPNPGLRSHGLPLANAHQHQPKLKVAALDAPAFTRLLGPLREIMERRAGENYGR